MNVSRWLIGLLAVFSVMFFSCGSDDDDGKITNSLMGAWVGDNGNSTIFNANGAGLSNGEHFLWHVENGVLYIGQTEPVVGIRWDPATQRIAPTGQEFYFKNSFAVSVSGNSLTMISGNGDKLVLNKN